ncbi:MAG: MBL fold metallo-hydrolase [Opitutaceae bacterium]|nr:MBL fold metallo-hydrolase [Opitutaceae bacterium]
MARIPLEDNFNDVINKAQRGLKISDEELIKLAEVTPEQLAAVKEGKPLYGVIRRVARHLRLSPDALEQHAKRLWYPTHPMFPRGFAAFNTPHEDMTVNSYLIWDSRERIAAAFDTGANCDEMLSLIAAEKLKLHYIFLTHTHPDHIAALPRLAAETKASVWSSELEPVDFPGAQFFKPNAHFHLGPLAIKTLLTSGHSPGQTTFYVTGLSWPLAIVGDSIFASSMGGSPTHHTEQWRNNREKILVLPRDTVLACGHGPLTTVAQEREHNPFFAHPKPVNKPATPNVPENDHA